MAGKKTYSAELFLTGDTLIHESVYQAAKQEDGSTVQNTDHGLER